MRDLSHLKLLLIFLYQYVEDIQTKLPPISKEIKDKTDDLSKNIKDRKLVEKVSQAETHAAQLNDSSAILDRYVFCF